MIKRKIAIKRPKKEEEKEKEEEQKQKKYIIKYPKKMAYEDD